jgi:plasmid stabilization system protein ParE
VGDKKRLAIASPEQERDYYKLVDWLEQHGESIAEAEEDAARWAARGKIGSFKKMKELDDAEIAERKAREKAAKDKATEEDTTKP